MKKKILLYIVSLGILTSCTDGKDAITSPETPSLAGENENLSAKGIIEYTGGVKMEDGPHDLLIVDNNLYAVRDNKVFLFSISNPAIPVLKQHFVGSGDFGKLYFADGSLFIPSKTDGHLYEFDAQLSQHRKIPLGIATFKPNTILKDTNGNWWIGGSNGGKGILAKYTKSGNSMMLTAQWIAQGNDSMIESIIEKDNHIIVSIPKGDLLSFDKSNLAAGIIKTVTYNHEAGHEKWGHTLLKLGNNAFWANWGAGFATVNISNPKDMNITGILSNSKFKSQFPDAEGTNVYDVAYNSSKELLCIANGWSGVILVKPNAPDQAIDFLDIKDVQNRCIETKGDYIYTGNISGGISGDMKGLKIYKIKR